jgi:hypothetical protein
MGFLYLRSNFVRIHVTDLTNGNDHIDEAKGLLTNLPEFYTFADTLSKI